MTTALYRRYRPQTFAEVIGQDHVTAPLRAALRSGQVNHAYLFSGPRGCGKTSSARILARFSQPKKALGLAWLSRGFAAEAAARGFACNEGFAGYSDFRADRDYGSDFARYLAAPGRRHLIMCHPGHVDDELARLDPVTASREAELAFLLSERFPRLLEETGARLVRLSKIAPAS